MSAERIKHSQETEHKIAESERLEHQERLQENREKAGERSQENVNDIQKEALEKARGIEKERRSDTSEHAPSPAERRANRPSKAEYDATFNATMSEVRSHMSAPGRAFSKVIHNETVEKVSEAAGNTIARPNAVLSGAVFAFILTLAVYLVAKNLGYPLSGFETMGAFAFGWGIGILYDFLKVMITGRK